MPRRGTKKEYTMKRKLFTLFVAALALVCLVLPMTVGAADGLTFTLEASKMDVKANEEFTVDVVVANNPGFCSPTVNVAYDADKLELVAKAKEEINGEIYTDGELYAVNFEQNPVVISFNSLEIADNKKNGKLATLTFKAKVDVSYDDMGFGMTTDVINAAEDAIENKKVFKRFADDIALAASATVPYDKAAHKLTVENLPADATASYTYNGNVQDEVVAAGVYTVVATITGENYPTIELPAQKLTITPAELTLTAVDKTKTGTFTPAVCRGDDVTLNGDKVAIALDAEDGKWYATGFELAGADKDNYTLVNADAKIEVAVDEATDVVTVTIVRDVEGTPETLETLKFFKGSTAVIKAPEVEGYHFAKWGDDKTDNPLVIKNIVGDAEGKMTLVAFYNKIQYINITVMQKLGDNDATVVKGPFKHEKNTAYTVTAEKVVNKDFVFKQWEDENGDKISTDEKIDILPFQDTTLVAVYDEDTNAAAIAIIIAANNKKKVTISFDTMGAAKIPAQELKKGELATMPATPKKDGYVFAGWYVESTYKTRFDFTQPVEESATLTAKWVGVSRALIMTIDSKVASAFGKTVENDVAPIIVKDRTMLPARFVAENLGAKVEWNAAKRQATITGNGVTIVLTIDSTTATVNGKAVTLDSPAFIQNDRTYTPVRFIAEALGAQVEWNATTRQAVIIK